MSKLEEVKQRIYAQNPNAALSDKLAAEIEDSIKAELLSRGYQGGVDVSVDMRSRRVGIDASNFNHPAYEAFSGDLNAAASGKIPNFSSMRAKCGYSPDYTDDYGAPSVNILIAGLNEGLKAPETKIDAAQYAGLDAGTSPRTAPSSEGRNR